MAQNFEKELQSVDAFWSPKVVGRINDQYVKVAKLKGTLAWHKHDNEDEMFFIVKGNLEIEYEDRTVSLSQGDFHIVPKGKMHNPVAHEECWIALIEPVTTQHTGDLVLDKTKSIEDQLSS